MMRKLWLVVMLVVVMVIAIPSLAYAIATPGSADKVTVKAVYVYEDCQEAGDLGVLIDYLLDYSPITTAPNETVSDSYMTVFIAADGTTQLKTVAPYPYYYRGYGRGLSWIHFTATEVSSYGLSSTNLASYKIWLTGNPALSWTQNGTACDPPKTVAGIDQWNTSGNTSVLLALRVLYYASELEKIWSGYDLIQQTPSGNKLTTDGESYFQNVIPNLRTIAPNCFSASSSTPTPESINYAQSFGATVTGTNIVGSPVTLVEGANTVTSNGTGAFAITLNSGVSGTVTNNGGTVSGSPVSIVKGTNTVTVTSTGTLTVTVALQNTQSVLTATIAGTMFDLSDVATAFGMSTMMFSGLVWFALSLCICAALYKGTKTNVFGESSSGKIMLVVFDVCIIGGALLGLLSILVAALLFLVFGVFVGYIVFFRGASF